MTLYLSLSLWRDISLIWLSLFCLIGLAIPLALLYFGVRGMDIALNKTTAAMQTARSLSSRTRVESEKLSRRVIAPVVRVNRTAARWQRVGRALSYGSPPTRTKHSGSNR